MQFCEICSNMLYINVDAEKHLTEYCKNCNFQKKTDDSTSKIIIDSIYNSDEVNYSLHLNKFTKFDKTIPILNNIICNNTNCTKKTSDDNKIMIIKYDNTNLKYIYLCCHCDNFWTNN